MQIYRENGYRNVRELDGGISDWQDAGYPVTMETTDITVTEPSRPTRQSGPVFQPYLSLNEGQTAIDFWLKDINGKVYSLFEMVKEKPIMMQFGSYT